MRLNWRGTRCYHFFPFSKGKFLSFLSAVFRGEELKCCKRGNKAAFSRLEDAGENFMAKPPPFELRQQQRPPRATKAEECQKITEWFELGAKRPSNTVPRAGTLSTKPRHDIYFLTLLLLLLKVLGFRTGMEQLIHHGKHQTRRGYISWFLTFLPFLHLHLTTNPCHAIPHY